MTATKLHPVPSLDRSHCIPFESSDPVRVHLQAVTNGRESGDIPAPGSLPPSLARNVCGNPSCVNWGHWTLVPQIRFLGAHARGTMLPEHPSEGYTAEDVLADFTDGADMFDYRAPCNRIDLFVPTTERTGTVLAGFEAHTYRPTGTIDGASRPVYEYIPKTPMPRLPWREKSSNP